MVGLGDKIDSIISILLQTVTDVSRHCMRPRFRTITLEANNDPSLNPSTVLEF